MEDDKKQNKNIAFAKAELDRCSALALTNLQYALNQRSELFAQFENIKLIERIKSEISR